MFEMHMLEERFPMSDYTDPYEEEFAMQTNEYLLQLETQSDSFYWQSVATRICLEALKAHGPKKAREMIGEELKRTYDAYWMSNARYFAMRQVFEGFMQKTFSIIEASKQ